MKFIYRTPKCPRCESIKTGRYIEYHGFDPDKLQAEYLRKGEFVIPAYTHHTNNLYCINCGLEWTGSGKWEFIKNEEWKALMEDLEIEETDIDALEDHGVFATIEKKKKKKHRMLKMAGKIVDKMIIKRFTEPLKDTGLVNPVVKDDFDEIMKEIELEKDEAAETGYTDEINEEPDELV